MGRLVPLLVAAYSVARHAPARRAAVGVGLLAAALVIVELRVPVSGTAANIPFIWVPVGVAVAAGRALRARESRLGVERDASVRVAVTDERERIARELHDLIAQMEAAGLPCAWTSRARRARSLRASSSASGCGRDSPWGAP